MLLRLLKLMFPDGEATPGGTPSPSGKDGDQKPEETDTVALAKALKETRENSVPREEYEKLRKEKEQLVSDIINGGGSAGSGQQVPPPQEASVEDLREKLYGSKGAELNNLETIETTLQLRKAVIKRDGYDPFLPHGANIKPSELDIERAEAVAQTLQECIDEAKGDSGVFTALLQKKIADDSPVLTAHLKKLGIKF